MKCLLAAALAAGGGKHALAFFTTNGCIPSPSPGVEECWPSEVCGTSTLHFGSNVQTRPYEKGTKWHAGADGTCFFSLQRVLNLGARSSKGQTLGAQTLTLEVTSSMIARPDKAARGGDDAYFVSFGDAGALDLGVFDGVGGWARRGHDPGVFTRGFAKATAANIKAQRAEQAISLKRFEREGEDPQRFRKGVDLQQALEYARTSTQLSGKQGTCTACVVTFDPKFGMLSGLNIGDSGALLVRRDAQGTPFVALRTATQRHSFNQPYQLGTGSRDRPHDAREFLFYVRDGDVVVLATDGLLDNMFEADILRCIRDACETESTAHTSHKRQVDLAAVLARRAFALSRDRERVSPWEEDAVAAGVMPKRGSGEPPSVGGGVEQSGWAKWGLALERAISLGMKSLVGGSDDATDEKQGDPSIPEEDMVGVRGGKMDDITVLVARVRRSGSRRRIIDQCEEKGQRGGNRGEDDGACVELDASSR